MVGAELLHHHADLRIMHVADIRKQMVLNLILEAPSIETGPASQSGNSLFPRFGP